jgi:ankyrin repeat protein
MASGDEEAPREVNSEWASWASGLSDDEIVDRLRPNATTAGEWMGSVSELLRQGRPWFARRLVERGLLAPDAVHDEDRMAIVHLAAMHGAVGLLRFLILQHGVDPNSRECNGHTPLLMALCRGREGAAAFLLEETPNCDVGAIGIHGTTPLMAAAVSGLLG